MTNPITYLRSVKSRVIESFHNWLQRQIAAELDNSLDEIHAEIEQQVNRAVENAINEYDFSDIVCDNLPEDQIIRAVADELSETSYSDLSVDIGRAVAETMEDGDSPLSTAVREIAHAEIRHLLDLIGESVSRMK